MARLEVDSKNAEIVVKSIDIDNVNMKGLRIKSYAQDNLVITEVESESIRTMLNTLDDIIYCQMVAEKNIS